MKPTENSDSGRVVRELFFDANPNPLFVFAERGLGLLAVNQAMVAKYGWSREELLAMKVTDLRSPDEATRLLAALDGQRGSTAAAVGEWRHRAKDGTCFDVEVTVSCVEFDGREARLVMVNDITERKRAEAILREREEQLRLFIEYAPAAIAMFDREMRCLAVSRRWIDDYGIPGEPPADGGNRRVFPGVPGDWGALHARGLAGEALHSDGERVERPDGGVRWVKWEILPWRDSRHEIGGILLAVEDITSRMEAEGALRASEKRFRGTFENAAVGMAHVAPDGRWLRVNGKLCEIVGYTREELLGMTFADITHPDDLQVDWTNARLALAGEIDSFSTEKRYIHKDGTIRWISLNVSLVRTAEGRPEYFISVMRDIGARKRAEQALAKSERRFRAMTEKAAEDVILMKADGTVVYESPNETSLLGFEPGEMTGASGFALVHPEDKEETLRSFANLVARPGGSLQGEVRMRRKDGWWNWVHYYATNLLDDHAVESIVVNLHNITERKNAEEALRGSEEQIRRINEELEARVAERTSELAAANRELEAFSYSVSHDLRAPLRALGGFSQILLLDHADRLNDEGRDYLRRILSASQRMGDLIDALLQLAGVTRGELHSETVDFSALAVQVAAELQAGAPDRGVEWLITPGLEARGDPRLLRLLLENLLGNAWKYTAGNPAPRIEFGATDEDGVRVWHVRDNGAGFDANEAGRLFTPFQRLHTSREFAGIGIGLATVQRIVSRHGGTIRAESPPGQGAAFRFTLAPGHALGIIGAYI